MGETGTSFYYSADYLDGQVFLDLKTAETRWGSREFSPKDFKNGSTKVRSQMAASLIRGKAFLGKNAHDVKNALGAFTGYFWSSSVPAYLIEEGWANNAESWQIAFLLDDSGKIKDIKVHKNCCNESHP